MELDAPRLQELRKEKRKFWEMKKKLEKEDKRWLRQDLYVLAKHPFLGKWRKGRILSMRPSKNSSASMVKSDCYQEYYIRFENQDKRNDCWLTYECLKQISEPVDEENWCDVYRMFSNEHRNDNPHYGLSVGQLDLH
jgi:wobble nucleotide-excising tRNase